MNWYIKHDERGQSLVEMIVVVGMVVLLVMGIVAGTTVALGRTQTVQMRSAAVKYAQEGIELTRSLRDTGWDMFAAMGTVESMYCTGDDGVFTLTATSCSDPNVHDVYTRTIILRLLPASGASVEKMSVTVVVAWGDITNPSNSVSLVTHLTQWQ